MDISPRAGMPTVSVHVPRRVHRASNRRSWARSGMRHRSRTLSDITSLRWSRDSTRALTNSLLRSARSRRPRSALTNGLSPR